MRVPKMEVESPLKDRKHCELGLSVLFEDIARHHGREAARLMFGRYGPLTARQRHFEKNIDLAMALLSLPDHERNRHGAVTKLARRFARENKNRRRQGAGVPAAQTPASWSSK